MLRRAFAPRLLRGLGARPLAWQGAPPLFGTATTTAAAKTTTTTTTAAAALCLPRLFSVPSSSEPGEDAVPYEVVMKDPYDTALEAKEAAAAAAEAAGDMPLEATMNDMASVLTDASVEPLVFDPTSLWYLTCYPLQLTLNAMHEVGLPWWAAVVGLTVVLRTAMLPLAVLQQRTAAKMSYVRPRLETLNAQLKQKRESGTLTSQDSIEYREKSASVLREHNVKMRHNFAGFANMPVFMSFFFALRSFPTYYPEIATGGVLWFKNLAIADPYVALPILSSVTMLMMLELGAEGAGQMQKTIKNVFRVVAVVMVPAVKDFPAILLVYWVASNFYSLFQTLLLRWQPVRRYLNILPMYDPEKHGPDPGKAAQRLAERAWGQSESAPPPPRAAKKQRKENIINIPPRSIFTKKKDQGAARRREHQRSRKKHKDF